MFYCLRWRWPNRYFRLHLLDVLFWENRDSQVMGTEANSGLVYERRVGMFLLKRWGQWNCLHSFTRCRATLCLLGESLRKTYNKVNCNKLFGTLIIVDEVVLSCQYPDFLATLSKSLTNSLTHWHECWDSSLSHAPIDLIRKCKLLISTSRDFLSNVHFKLILKPKKSSLKKIKL